MSDQLLPPASAGETRQVPVVRQLRDALIGGGLFTAGILMLLAGVQPFTEFPAPVNLGHPLWHAVPLGVACLAVCVQTRFPSAVFGVATLALIVDATIGLHLAMLVAWSNAIYVVGRYGSAEARFRVKWVLIVFCLAIGTWTWLSSGNLNTAFMGISQISVFAALAFWWSGEVRTGHERAKVEELRADAVRRHAEVTQIELVRQERASLASRLHDTISSKLSTVALYTTGTLDLPPDEKRDRQVLGEIRESTLSALCDMRELIEVLRSCDFDVDNEADDNENTLASAVATAKSAGLRIDIEAEPLTVDPVVSRLLGRFGSEALSNAMKHGDGEAKLQLNGSANLVRISVENGLRTAAGFKELPEGVSGGAGLGSMALQVKQAGGRFGAGEHLQAGKRIWRTFAELPRNKAEEHIVESLQ